MEAVQTPLEAAPLESPSYEKLSEDHPLFGSMQLIAFYDPRLTKRPEDFVFEEGSDYAKTLSAALHQKMVQLGTFGLSANQVGLDHRVFVVGTENKRIMMFNPKIIGYTKETVALEEACVSMPGFSLVLQRPEGVHVTYQDENGEYQSAYYTGVSSRIIQHEYDHMEGRNFSQYASNFKLKRELKKYQNKQKKMVRKLQSKVY